MRAAMRIIDAEGIEELSMRRLARELDSAPMSLYRHVRNKKELLALVAEEVVRQLPKAPPPDASWRETITTVMCDLRRVLLDHPGVASLVGHPLTLTPDAVLSQEAVLSALDRAGLDAADGARVASTLWMFTFGSVLVEQSPVPTVLAEGCTQADAELRSALRNAGAPLLAEAVATWETDTRSAIFLRGLDALLNNVEMLVTASQHLTRTGGKATQ